MRSMLTTGALAMACLPACSTNSGHPVAPFAHQSPTPQPTPSPTHTVSPTPTPTPTPVPSPAFSQFPLPSADAAIFGIIAGPGNALWFIEPKGIGRLTTSGVLTNFRAPAGGNTPLGIAEGPDGAVWFTESRALTIGRLTSAGTFTDYAVAPTAFNAGGLGEIANGPDGALWFTEFPAGIGRISVSGDVRQFSIGPAGGSPDPGAIVTGSDGALWFTEDHGIGRMTTSGAYTRYRIQHGSPFGITAGPEGALWFTVYVSSIAAGTHGYSGDLLGRLSTSGVLKTYRLDGGTPFALTTGPDGALWFGETNYVVRATTSGSVTRYTVPAAPGYPGYITTGPDGALWFTDGGIGRVTDPFAGPAALAGARR